MKRRMLAGLIAVIGALPALAGSPATYTVSVRARDSRYMATATVEAVRQGTLGAQVSGRVIEVLVRSGETVKAGQPLIRIDAEDAVAAASAGAATASGAAARLATARADFERAQRLQAQQYISVAALQKSEAALRTAEAEARATEATAGAANARAGWRAVSAPYAGTVTQVLVTAGDLATPGRPLVTLYAPGALRLIAQLPESLAGRLQGAKPAVVVFEGAIRPPLEVSNWFAVEAVDPATHSVTVRAELPAGTPLQPGQFARLSLPLRDTAPQLRIPARTVLHRSEVDAVYVVDASGAAHLRQVRLGPVEGEEVVVLAGLKGGEQIAVDPVAAASH
jgi:membrane fusion protein, multidrug efflux system